MKSNPLPSVEELNEFLNYDPDTGQFTWKTRRGRIRAGSIAGSLHKHTRYVHIKINGKSYQSHRLAYKMFYGSDPVDMLDHIDCDKSNNRIANLRDATNAQNKINTGPPKNNTSGFKGVSANSDSSKKPWAAQIIINKKKIHLGRYKTKEEAALTYEKAAKELYGEFVRGE